MLLVVTGCQRVRHNDLFGASRILEVLEHASRAGSINRQQRHHHTGLRYLVRLAIAGYVDRAVGKARTHGSRFVSALDTPFVIAWKHRHSLPPYTGSVVVDVLVELKLVLVLEIDELVLEMLVLVLVLELEVELVELDVDVVVE